MDITAFFFAASALLLVPGPTNTLMGVAAAEGGMKVMRRLVPAEIAGYLTAILPLAIAGQELLAGFPAFGTSLKLVAAIWIMALAFKLWGVHTGVHGGHAVDAKRIFLTTALNPKGLIFALVLLPAVGDPTFTLHLMLLCVLIALAGLVWGQLGALMSMPGTAAIWMQRLHQAAAVWLAFVSLSLIYGAMHA